MLNYKVKYTKEEVQHHIKQMVDCLVKEKILTDECVYIVMMNGGCWFAMHLFDYLGDMNNPVYFVHAHSYHGTERGALEWDYMPKMDIEGKDVVVLDDICDSGATMEAMCSYLKEERAPRSINVVTLLKRSESTISYPLHSCITDFTPDFFVGCGLDDNGYGRMLPFVGVV